MRIISICLLLILPGSFCYGQKLNVTGEIRHIKCPDDKNGRIKLNIKGGKAPYQFNWSDGSQSDYIVNVGSGKYQCTISDANGSNVTKTFYIKKGQDVDVRYDISEKKSISFSVNDNNRYRIRYVADDGEFGVFSSSKSNNVKRKNYKVYVTNKQGCVKVFDILNSTDR